MRLQLAALNIIALLVVIYVAMGAAIYVNDVAQDWCGQDFSFGNLGAYLLIWPFRLFYGDGYCD